MAATPAEETVVTEAPATETKPVTEDVSSLSSDQIAKKLKGVDPLDTSKKTEKPAEPVKTEAPKEEEWFDKEHGFKTKDDAIKSYGQAANKIRELSEQNKQAMAEIQKIKETRTLTPEEKQKEEAVKQWQMENKEAIDFLKKTILDEVTKSKSQEEWAKEVLNTRNQWYQDFQKDEKRKELWPKMEEIFNKHGIDPQSRFEGLMGEIGKNPFQVLEALAFKENFPSILEGIKKEAIEQYKEELRQAAEAEKKSKTATPGGLKSLAGDVDVSKMSASELAALLPRGDRD